MNNKGQLGLNGIPNVVWMLMMIGIMVGLTVIVLAEFKDVGWGMYNVSTGNASDFNDSIDTTITSLGEVPDWLSLLIVVVFIAIIVMLISLVRSQGRD